MPSEQLIWKAAQSASISVTFSRSVTETEDRLAVVRVQWGPHTANTIESCGDGVALI